MGDDLDVLEKQLLVLGRQELSLEQDLQRLRSTGRAAAAEGDENRAESAWRLYEEARARLSSLQKQIAQLEMRVYALRRRQRK